MYSFIYSICITIQPALPLLPHLQAAKPALRPRAVSQAHAVKLHRYYGGIFI